jgi:hypothetical protein
LKSSSTSREKSSRSKYSKMPRLLGTKYRTKRESSRLNRREGRETERYWRTRRTRGSLKMMLKAPMMETGQEAPRSRKNPKSMVKERLSREAAPRSQEAIWDQELSNKHLLTKRSREKKPKVSQCS